jgi:phenylacetate-coenzyme A ligase PaaK-like adenylate-forming protein
MMFFPSIKKMDRQAIFPDLMSRWIITSSENIREYKVIQELDHSLHITIDPLVDKDLEGLKNNLIQRILKESEVFGVTPNIEVRFESISLPSDMSKYKRFVVKKD